MLEQPFISTLCPSTKQIKHQIQKKRISEQDQLGRSVVALENTQQFINIL